MGALLELGAFPPRVLGGIVKLIVSLRDEKWSFELIRRRKERAEEPRKPEEKAQRRGG